MNYYNLNDIPNRVMTLAEDKIPEEENFKSLLKRHGVQDTSRVSEDTWDAIEEDLKNMPLEDDI